MSTRYARTADKALNEKHSTILKGLLKEPGNKYCADCKRKGLSNPFFKGKRRCYFLWERKGKRN